MIVPTQGKSRIEVQDGSGFFYYTDVQLFPSETSLISATDSEPIISDGSSCTFARVKEIELKRRQKLEER